MAKKSKKPTVLIPNNTTYTLNPATTLSNISLTAGPFTYSTTASVPWYTSQPKVRITDSDIELDGLSLRQTLLDLQSRLGIMVPNPELEKEFKELRECAQLYQSLEQKFLEQKAMWETLKKTDQQ
jgi:hypothetical protein